MGIYRWRKGDDGLVREPREKAAADRNPASADDLDIEKKWLQLVRIDQERFNLFFDKYHDRIFRYIYLRIGDHDVAGELAGEVFIIAWKRIGRFTWQGYSFGAWLFQIARGVISSELRRRRRRRETVFDPEAHDGRVDSGDRDDLLDPDDRWLIRRCVAGLPDVRQDVIVLHYWMGMSLDQVSVVLKMPRGTVSSHLHRARRQLMGLLREAGLSEEAMRVVRGQEIRDSGLKGISRPSGSGDGKDSEGRNA